MTTSTDSRDRAGDTGQRARDLLRIAPFRWLVLGTTVNKLGSSLAPVALAFAVLDLTHSAAQLGLVVGARSAATLIFLLLGGALSDRLPRGLVLAGSSVASAATQAAVAVVLLAHVDSVAALCVLSALNGAFSAISGPATSGLLPLTVGAGQLTSANALARLLQNGASVVGLAVAGLVVALVGSGPAIAVDAATFAFGAVCFALLKLDALPHTHSGGFLRALAEGWRAFASRSWVWSIVVAFTLANAVYVGGIVVLGPAVADATFGRTAWGVILAAESVGFVAGGVVALRWRPRRPLLAGIGCGIACSLLLFALGVHAPVAVLVAAAFVGGLGVEQFGVAWETALGEHVPIELLSRVSSYDQLGSFLAIPVGQVLAGPAAARIGLEPTLVGGGAILAASLAATLLVPSVRRLTSAAGRPAGAPDTPHVVDPSSPDPTSAVEV
ncbi:MFS transporter [Frondihabitans australicus]|uniref:Putative MFS family arabinose efflux permease n=1 Tax=Frondihabitans australicus TaxID=386892 RepID=A0A495IF31_9MICO|nr:MFS transporter [Frondihabitans australicus]RKR73951.1 putative MFS family arabinose efflux permease [Frondihabitans australicus]